MSSSKIVASTAGGHHLLTIEGHSSTKSSFPNGKGIKSSPFTVGGHRWSILYYPNGIDAFSWRYVSLYLVLEESVASPVTARIQFCFESAAEERHCLVPWFPKKTKKAPIKSGEGKLGTHGSWGWAKFIKRSDLETKYLKADSFTLKCDIVVINGIRAEEAAPAMPRAFVTVPPSDMDRCLRGLHETGSGADVTFEVAGERFTAHRWLLAARSPAFSAELLEQGGTSDGVVRVDKMEPRVFKALLSFMYTDSLSLPETTTKQEEAALAQHLLVAAHRYGVERLKLLCEERLCGSIDIGTAANILALAERLGCRGLKDACFDFLGRSPANLKAVMARDGFAHLSATCPSVLKELVTLGFGASTCSVIDAHSNGGSINNISPRSLLVSSGYRYDISLNPATGGAYPFGTTGTYGYCVLPYGFSLNPATGGASPSGTTVTYGYWVLPLMVAHGIYSQAS